MGFVSVSICKLAFISKVENLFHSSGRRYSGTYLPGVATEQGWTKEETLSSLARKAGYRGQMTKELVDSISVTRYQSQKITLDYDNYHNGQF